MTEAVEQGDFLGYMWHGGMMALDILTITSTCFDGDTLVAAEEGQKRIDEIEAGDYVWAYNVEIDELELKEVLTVYVKENDEILHLKTTEGDIDTTTNHPFYVVGEGWVAAGDLKAGDEILTIDGSVGHVLSFELEKLDAPIPVYNIEVDAFHTYFVGDGDGWVLVHNQYGEAKEAGKVKFQSTTTKKFWKIYERLPKEIQKAADKAFQIFKNDPASPSLKFEDMPELGKGVWSARVTGKYRALGKMIGDTVEWFAITNHYQ